MAEFVEFHSRAELSARENLERFISYCRYDLSLYNWDDLKWTSPQFKKGGIVFTRFIENATPYPTAADAMVEPFLSAAKAFVRYQQSIRESTAIASFQMQAIRLVHDSLEKIYKGISPDVLNLDGRVQLKAAQLLIERYENPATRNKIGNGLVTFYKFFRDRNFTPSLPMWKNPNPRQKAIAEQTSPEALEWQDNRRLPLHVISSLADCFARAESEKDLYWSAVSVLLMFAPNRVGELASLTIDCLVESEGHLYVRWWGKKGFGPTLKKVPAVMEPAVRLAVKRLINIGSAARIAAKNAYTKRGELYEEALKKYSPKTWRSHADAPPSAGDTERPIWESLCISLDRQFHADFKPIPCSWVIVDANLLNDQLNGRQSNGKALSKTIFDRFGKTDPDGNPIRLTTHQLRVWISTVAERAGMDDYTLAVWAARADPKHNAHYDLRTQDERSESKRFLKIAENIDEKTRVLASVTSAPNALQLIRMQQPVALIELGTQMVGAAQATLYGWCTTDWAQSPCSKAHQCLQCKELKCVKGDDVKLLNLKRHVEFLERQMQLASNAVKEDEFGAEAWFERSKNELSEASRTIQRLTWELSHAKTFVAVLEDPSVPIGSVISMPPSHDVDPAIRMLESLNSETSRRSLDETSPESVFDLIGINRVED